MEAIFFDFAETFLDQDCHGMEMLDFGASPMLIEC